ncbi:MAG: aspartate aminotransferase family protein [Chloroflexia bacterium]|nr:aspartate aminotransferase family protein [Chloroflexia bacterium]
MNLFDVYSKYNVNLVKAKGAKLLDSDGKEYLDFYGGHGVISIGHSHPKYIKALTEQLNNIAFYTNVIENKRQEELAKKLGKLSGYDDYGLFVCNSGAEAVENALKVASFYTEKGRIIAMKGAFHGRTSGAIAATDNPAIWSEYNKGHQVSFIELDDKESLLEEFRNGEIAAVIIEGIQGVGGVYEGSEDFLHFVREICDANDACLILDEIQSGYGRSGKFFAHQYAGIQADIITAAKGMGNGFPIAGVLISPKISAKKGMLGTTYGGNHLACAAGVAVLDIMKDENLMQNAQVMGDYLWGELQKIEEVTEIRGRGLMVGFVIDGARELRRKLIYEKSIFTGFSEPDVIRLLPPLNVTEREIDLFINSFKSAINTN